MARLITNPNAGLGATSAGAVSVTAAEKALQQASACLEFFEVSDLATINSGSNSGFSWRGRKANTALTPKWSAAPTIVADAINSLPCLRFVSNGALTAGAGSGLLTPEADYSFVYVFRNPTGTAGNGTVVGNACDAGDGYFGIQHRSDNSLRVFHDSNDASAPQIDDAAAFSDDTWYAFLVSYDFSEKDLVVERNGGSLVSNLSVGAEIITGTGGDELLIGSSGRTAQAAASNHDLAALYIFDRPLAHADYATLRGSVETRINERYGITFA